MDYQSILHDLLDGNHYLSLATADARGVPWSSPVAYQYDNDCLYFVSHENSRHVKNIFQNPRVAFSIFNSTQTAGNAFGVQGSGVVEKIDAMDVPALTR